MIQAGVTSGMRYVYNQITKFDIDPKSGNKAVYKDPNNPKSVYGRNNSGHVNYASDNHPVGSIVETPNNPWHEGGIKTDWINDIFLGVATSAFHDDMFSYFKIPFNNWTNYSTMPLAMGITGVGYLETHYISNALIIDKSNRSRK